MSKRVTLAGFFEAPYDGACHLAPAKPARLTNSLRERGISQKAAALAVEGGAHY